MGPWDAGQEFDKVERLAAACGTRPVALCEAAISGQHRAGAGKSAPTYVGGVGATDGRTLNGARAQTGRGREGPRADRPSVRRR